MLQRAVDITEDIAPLPGSTASDDYGRVTDIIAYISRRWRKQPSVEEIAAHVGLTPTQVHQLFRRWAGLTPKAFLQAVTLDAAKRMVADTPSLLDAAYELGLSGPGRLHDLFVTHEAMSPGEWKTGGAGLSMTYGFHPSPFGEAIVVTTPRGLAGLGFVDNGDRAAALADMQVRWRNASFLADQETTAPVASRVFDPQRWRSGEPLRIVLIGTDWEVRVWEALLAIPMGRAETYGGIAGKVCTPRAARAVGAAVGKNPISFVVPCHRVVGKSGALTGYHWGLTRKQAMLGWELGRTKSEQDNGCN